MRASDATQNLHIYSAHTYTRTNTSLNKKILANIHRQFLRKEKSSQLKKEIGILAQNHERENDRCVWREGGRDVCVWMDGGMGLQHGVYICTMDSYFFCGRFTFFLYILCLHISTTTYIHTYLHTLQKHLHLAICCVIHHRHNYHHHPPITTPTTTTTVTTTTTIHPLQHPPLPPHTKNQNKPQKKRKHKKAECPHQDASR